MLKWQWKHLRQEQDQLQFVSYNVSSVTNDNIVAYLDQWKSSSKEAKNILTDPPGRIKCISFAII